MNLEIRFTPEAGDTYESIIIQLRARWGDTFVDKLELKIRTVLKTISSTPYLPYCR